MKKRVAIFTHNYPITSSDRRDAGNFVHAFAHELANHVDVFVFCPDFGGKKEHYKKVPVTWFDWGGPKVKFGNWPLFSPISVYNFFKLIIVGSQEAEKFVKRNKIDYCLSCWVIPSAFYALWLNLKFKIPYSVWILGTDANKYAKLPILRQLSILSLRRADNRFANSYWLINSVKKLSGKNCLYMDAITNFSVEKVSAKKLDKKVFNFLFVGRLEKIKGPDILIKACEYLKSKRTDFRLYILGDGSMRSELQEAVRRAGIKDKVEFYGNAGREVVAEYMKGADCLIVASRMESIPLVMIEAARVGLPTISTDVGDDKRVINKYKVGYVSKKEDAKSMSLAMLKAMKESKNFKRKRSSGLRKLANSRSQKVSVATLLSRIK